MGDCLAERHGAVARRDVETGIWLVFAVFVVALAAGCGGGGGGGRIDRKLGAPFRPAVTSDAIWVPSSWAQAYPGGRREGCFCGVMRLDPRNGEVISVVDFSDLTDKGYDDLVADAATVSNGSLWVVLYQRGAIVRVDLDHEKPVLWIDGIPDPTAVTSGAGSIWVASADGFIWRIDPHSNRVLANISTPEGLTAIAYGHGSVWATGSGSYHEYNSTQVIRVDPQTNVLQTMIKVGLQPTDLAIGRRAVWVSVFGADRLVRIDPASNRVDRSVSVVSPDAVTDGHGAVWVATWDSNEIVEFDERSLKIRTRRKVRESPESIQLASGALWVTYADTGWDNTSTAVVSRLPLRR